MRMDASSLAHASSLQRKSQLNGGEEGRTKTLVGKTMQQGREPRCHRKDKRIEVQTAISFDGIPLERAEIN